MDASARRFPRVRKWGARLFALAALAAALAATAYVVTQTGGSVDDRPVPAELRR